MFITIIFISSWAAAYWVTRKKLYIYFLLIPFIFSGIVWNDGEPTMLS